jgi:hypothetical protein
MTPRLIELMDAWLNKRYAGSEFTTKDMGTHTCILNEEDKITPAGPMLTDEYCVTHYRQIIAEKQAEKNTEEFLNTIFAPVKIDWKYYRQNKYLINQP